MEHLVSENRMRARGCWLCGADTLARLRCGSLGPCSPRTGPAEQLTAGCHSDYVTGSPGMLTVGADRGAHQALDKHLPATVVGNGEG